MIASHSLGDLQAKGTVDNPLFILTNKLGGYLLLSGKAHPTRYCGQYACKDWQLYKFIDDIRLLGTEAEEVINRFGKVERRSGNARETFRLFRDSLIYEVTGFKGFINLWLDCRHMYDHDDMGRLYGIFMDGDKLVIEFTKHAGGQAAYRLFIAIKGANGFLRNEQWEERRYELDSARGSYPSQWWIYNAIKISVDANACREADRTYAHLVRIKQSLDTYYERTSNPIVLYKDPFFSLALCSAQRSLLDLIQDMSGERGLFAGFPWFHQFWTRDEAISAAGLMLIGRQEDARRILLRHLSMLGPDGTIPNRQRRFDRLGILQDRSGIEIRYVHTGRGSADFRQAEIFDQDGA
jgi:hypothetical protein